MGQAERVESGSTERRRRLEPGVLQTALLDEVAERLLSLETLARAEVPVGAVEPIEPITVTSQVRKVEAVYGPWHSVTVVNVEVAKGGHDVEVLVNSGKSLDWHRVAPGETYNIDMHRPLVKDILLRCRSGESSTVRLVGAR
jgi:hypothetical protein